ncbi:MAG: hypothetical protein C0423_01940 [Methylibium sp.]|nr:hypothetical protein [Methylibium sp.]
MISTPATGVGVVFQAASVVVDSDALVKRQYPTPGGSFCFSLEATDSLGAAQVTFAGVQAGSEIRVYLPDMTEVAGIENCAANQTLSWSVFAPGSPNNTVRIVILSTGYRLKEFNYTASVGAQNLPIQQERDQWYSNPA